MIGALSNLYCIYVLWACVIIEKLHFRSSPCVIFFLISYSLYTPVLLILILINAQYLENVVFSFEKGSSSQNLSSSDHHHLIKNPLNKSFIPLPLNAILKTLLFAVCDNGTVQFTYFLVRRWNIIIITGSGLLIVILEPCFSSL